MFCSQIKESRVTFCVASAVAEFAFTVGLIHCTSLDKPPTCQAVHRWWPVAVPFCLLCILSTACTCALLHAAMQALSQFGTDFSLISQLFPGRQRRHLKNKARGCAWSCRPCAVPCCSVLGLLAAVCAIWPLRAYPCGWVKTAYIHGPCMHGNRQLYLLCANQVAPTAPSLCSSRGRASCSPGESMTLSKPQLAAQWPATRWVGVLRRSQGLRHQPLVADTWVVYMMAASLLSGGEPATFCGWAAVLLIAYSC